MAANTTVRELNTHRNGLYLAKKLWYCGGIKKAIILVVLAMIASLPVAGCISATDNTRAPAAATAQLNRYRLTEYSPPIYHLQQRDARRSGGGASAKLFFQLAPLSLS